ncbi:hypothetical protein H9635_09410 [Solibacillus sp. A46]|uniref:Integral membrane protein n=1 Tax=Solibacillus faecavium TaxID=2762221 RepID=A0ABR8XYF4_9BACL|nr:hypothetical protein [Solibacillus faecavium]MBD8036961.1 hypothetical protein [Solibacillus faecavium]
MKLKEVINFLLYTAMIGFIGYFCHLLSELFMGMLLFIAADAPPGDISNSGRLFYIAFYTLGTLLVQFVYSVIHWSIASLLKIPFPKRLVIILNIVVGILIAGSLIYNFVINNGSFL